MTNKEKRDVALQMFLEEGFAKHKIASYVGVTPATISAWSEADNWDDHETDVKFFERTSKKEIYKLITRSFEVFNHQINEQRKEGIYKHPERGDVDALIKLFSSIKAKELSFIESVKLIIDYNEYIAKEDDIMGKRMPKFSDGFIAELRAKISKQ